ncbi:hypothetical protein ACOCJ5_04795 [Knoellia sp. CPCC 206450]|uniref:hypothetical protein n=1 Tax=Knoellia tibetensis TaxID=3404798 RepID=UPI003B42CAAB
MKVSEGDDSCTEHVWVTDAKLTTSDEAHVAKVCQHCSAVALLGPDLAPDTDDVTR